MIEYVDKLLKHWAQEVISSRSGAGFGVYSSWPDFGFNIGSADLKRCKRAGVFTAGGSESARVGGGCGIGKVAERIDKAVLRLPDRQRQALELQYLDVEKRPAEKAQVMGCATKTFYNLINRAHESISLDLPDTYTAWQGVQLRA